jgi:hypothetical protein
MKFDGVVGVVGKPALLPGEDLKKYDALFDEIWATISPNDVFEEVWVVDLANQIWETARYRRMMTKLLIAGQLAQEQTQRLFSAGRDSGRSVDKGELLHPEDWDEGEAISSRGVKVQRVNQMLAKAESRRAATLKAIERHRDGLGATLCRVAQDFETAETRKPAAVDGQKLAA